MMHRPAPGFTIVELITTIFILSILAVVIVPRMDALRGWDEIGYRDQVQATLEYARKMAVAQRRYVCVTRNVGGLLQMGGGGDLILTRDLRDPDGVTFATVTCPDSGANQVELFARDNRYCRNNPLPPNRICAPTAAGVALGATSPATLIFSPLGRANAMGTYTIQVNGATTATITVEAETGYVHE